jgi:hypothetical protein
MAMVAFKHAFHEFPSQKNGAGDVGMKHAEKVLRRESFDYCLFNTQK